MSCLLWGLTCSCVCGGSCFLVGLVLNYFAVSLLLSVDCYVLILLFLCYVFLGWLICIYCVCWLVVRLLTLLIFGLCWVGDFVTLFTCLFILWFGCPRLLFVWILVGWLLYLLVIVFCGLLVWFVVKGCVMFRLGVCYEFGCLFVGMVACYLLCCSCCLLCFVFIEHLTYFGVVTSVGLHVSLCCLLLVFWVLGADGLGLLRGLLRWFGIWFWLCFGLLHLCFMFAIDL